MDLEILKHRAAVAVSFGLALLSPFAVFAGEAGTTACFDGSPAIPVDQFRTIPGQGTFEMWPDNLQPVEPLATALPAERDSTQYSGFERPGQSGGLEFFYDLDIEEDPTGTYLYMVYNAGFQIWDIDGALATTPQLLSQRDGWLGDFDEFEDPVTEFYFKIWDIDAINPPASSATLVALPGELPIGLTIWDAADKSNPIQLYQDTGKVGLQVAAANIGGRSYVFYGANNGISVYDMTRAREIGPCFESTSTATNFCGGNSNPVWRGLLNPWPWGRAEYLAVLETEIGGQTRHFIAVSDGTAASALGTAIREITNAASLPPTATTIVEDLSTFSFGVDLFEVNDRHYLAVVNLFDLEIHDVTACLASSPGCSLAIPEVDLETAGNPLPAAQYVTFSESNGRPFLYKTSHSLCSRPPSTSDPDPEYLLDLSGLGAKGTVVDIRGEEYLDPNHTNPQRRIDYFTSYYDQSTDGFSAFSSHGGVFHGIYFYRASQSMFDIHEWTGDVAPSAEIEATSSDRWFSSPGEDEWVNLSGECNTGGDTGWSWSAANAPGTPGADPAPVVDPLGGGLARVRGGLCAADTYPSAACPDRTLLAEADVTCDGTPVTSNELPLTLEDPRPFFESVDILEPPDAAGPPPEYSVCQVLSFEALDSGVNEIGGKALTSFDWTITPTAGGDPISCNGAGAGAGLSCTETTLGWNTEDIDVGDPTSIFSDGFESGDTTRWNNSTKLQGAAAGVTFDVTLTASNEHGSIDQTTQLILTPLDSLAFLGDGFTIPGTPPADGIYNFTATSQNATDFYWEFEQDAALPGDPGCRLVTPCEIRTTTSAAVQYEWPIDNIDGADYDVWLEISNCDVSVAPISTVRTVENVVIVDLVPPDITAFKVVTVGTSCACFGGVCICPVGEASFTVTIDGDCDSLSFDWGDGMTDTGLACDSPTYTHDFTSTGTFTLEAEACFGGTSNCETQVNLTNISAANPIPLVIE